MNVKVKFIKDLIFWSGNFNEGDIYILTKDDADYFSDYLEVIEETNEKAVSI